MSSIGIIPALRRSEDISHLVESTASKVFLMFGELSLLPRSVQQLKKLGKKVYLHCDLMKGLSHDKEALTYIADHIQPAGIITTKGHMIKHAKSLGLEAILHLFIIDTNALTTGIEKITSTKPHGIEIMPGLMPDVVREIHKHTSAPLYVGGLVKTHEQAAALLDAGATGVVSGHTPLWH